MTGILGAFRPDAVAVIGASSDPERFGGRVFRYLQSRFVGSVYPINAVRASVGGISAFRSVTDAPPSSLAVVAVPAEDVEAQVRRCGEAGVQWVVVLASGFADAGGSGQVLQQRLLTAAHEAGVRIFGPNSVGIVNVANGLTATFASRLGAIDLRPGPLAVITQSGATGSALLSDLAAAGVPCGIFGHTGNEADVTVAELIEACASDPEIEVIAAYMETVRDPERLMTALRVAEEQLKPIVLLKAGSTPTGAVAAASHTGAMVRPDGALEALLSAHGVIQVHAGFEMVDVLQCLTLARRPPGDRTVIVTVSGGGGVMQADAAYSAGLDLPSAGPELRSALGTVLPPHASLGNPIDLTGAPIADPDMLERSLGAVDGSGQYDVLSLNFAAGERSASAFIATTADLARRSSSSVVVSWQGTDASVRQALARAGVPALSDPVRAIQAVAKVVHWAGHRRLNWPIGQGEPFHHDRASSPPHPTSKFLRAVPVDPEPLGVWLGQNGVPVVPTEYVSDPDHSRGAFERLGAATVAAKLVLAGHSHRTDMGGIRLGIASPDALERATRELLAVGASAASEGALPRVQVQPQLTGGHEVLVALRRDDTFGWMVVLGFGGILTEIVSQVRILPAGAGRPDFRAALGSLFDGRWVSHRRGLTVEDVEAVAELATQLSALAPSLDCTELELNPVIVKGGVARAVDWVAGTSR